MSATLPVYLLAKTALLADSFNYNDLLLLVGTLLNSPLGSLLLFDSTDNKTDVSSSVSSASLPRVGRRRFAIDRSSVRGRSTATGIVCFGGHGLCAW